jgi:hypothetical protein
MSKVDHAKKVAESYFAEVESTIEIRKTYNSIVIAMSGPLMAAQKDNQYAKNLIQDALKYKSVDPNAIYKPLVIQINGIFENYIRFLVSAVIEGRYENLEAYSELNETFRKNHIFRSSKVLSHIKSGSISGLSYNFDDLLANLAGCLSNKQKYKLNPEIYTKLMGNCTSKHLEELFEAISLPKPFSNLIGKNADLKSHFADQSKGRVAIRTKEKLDTQVGFRNNIVHGELTRVVDLGELQDSLNFFRALISGLDELVRLQN